MRSNSGATGVEGAKAVDARVEGGRVRSVTFRRGAETFEIECERLIVADGVRSGLGKMLGRQWHQDTVYAVAGRCYLDSTMADDPWISSHLELRSRPARPSPGTAGSSRSAVAR
jgi:flavin-dependent dehydrogenase